MAEFEIEKVVDAYVVYSARIEAESASEAAEFAYYGGRPICWARNSVDEFEACRVLVLDEKGAVIEEL